MLKLTKEQREVFVLMGRRGGPARALALSRDRRRQIAMMGAMARLRNVKLRAEGQNDARSAQLLNGV